MQDKNCLKLTLNGLLDYETAAFVITIYLIQSIIWRFTPCSFQEFTFPSKVRWASILSQCTDMTNTEKND